MKSKKTDLKKIITKIQKRKEKEKESKILWITIVIHSAMGMSEQWFPHIL
jgi:hypothetical protein